MAAATDSSFWGGAPFSVASSEEVANSGFPGTFSFLTDLSFLTDSFLLIATGSYLKAGVSAVISASLLGLMMTGIAKSLKWTYGRLVL